MRFEETPDSTSLSGRLNIARNRPPLHRPVKRLWGFPTTPSQVTSPPVRCPEVLPSPQNRASTHSVLRPGEGGIDYHPHECAPRSSRRPLPRPYPILGRGVNRSRTKDTRSLTGEEIGYRTQTWGRILTRTHEKHMHVHLYVLSQTDIVRYIHRCTPMGIHRAT